jgi:hypothetical protein
MATCRPAVGKTVLLFMAGSLWVAVGTMLLALAFTWLSQAPAANRYVLAADGMGLALIPVFRYRCPRYAKPTRP